MDLNGLNYWAVLVAALIGFGLGALWYSPAMFYKSWMNANGFTEEDVQKFNQKRAFGFSFIFYLIMAFNLAMFLQGDATDITWGMTAGFLTGFGWVALGIGVIALFENRSWKYIFINGGFMVVNFIIMGLIIGIWR